MLLYTHHTLFCKFHMVCISQLPKIWWQISVQLFDLLPFWIAQKHFCKIKIIFVINQFKNCRIYIYGKNSGKKIILVLQKIALIYRMPHVYIIGPPSVTTIFLIYWMTLLFPLLFWFKSERLDFLYEEYIKALILCLCYNVMEF